MSNISPLGAYLGFSEEAAFGTASGTVDNYLRVETDFEALELTREEVKIEGLDGVVADASEDGKGRRSVAGTLEFPLPFGGGWMMFLAHCCGKAVATTGAGPYAHTLDLSASPDITAKGITAIVGRAGLVPSGTSQAFAYRGIRPTAVEITISEQGVVKVSVDVFGKNLTYAAHAQPAADGSDYSSEKWIKTPSDASAPTALFTWGGTAYTIKSATIRIEQPWVRRWDPEDEDQLVPGLGDRRVITASVDVEMPDSAAASGGQFIDDHQQNNKRAAIFTLEGATPANESLVITLAKAKIVSPGEGHPSSGDIMRATIDLEAKRNGATSAGTVVLTNSESAAYA